VAYDTLVQLLIQAITVSVVRVILVRANIYLNVRVMLVITEVRVKKLHVQMLHARMVEVVKYLKALVRANVLKGYLVIRVKLHRVQLVRVTPMVRAHFRPGVFLSQNFLYTYFYGEKSDF